MAFFEDDREFHDIVSEFVRTGLAAGDTVIVIATEDHRRMLAEHFARELAQVEPARVSGRYIELDTNEVYDLLLTNGWPDRDRIDALMVDLLDRARQTGNNVRCVGEIVAVIWNRGKRAATILLEHIWRELSRTENVMILCLYPRSSFDERMGFGLGEVDRAHSNVEH
jgi:hypothetical protein